MNPAPSLKGCPQEVRVVRATRTGQWDDALKAHAAACAACGEVALVSSSLRTFALETEGHNRLPDPYLVWLKAKLTERQVVRQRASKPWDIAEALGQCVVAVALAGWLVVELSSIYQGLAEWRPVRQLDYWSQVWSLITSAVSVPPSLVFWTLTGLICFATLLVAEPLFSED